MTDEERQYLESDGIAAEAQAEILNSQNQIGNLKEEIAEFEFGLTTQLAFQHGIRLVSDEWDTLPEKVKDYYRGRAGQIHSLYLERIEKLENPYPRPFKSTAMQEIQRVAFEDGRDAILLALEQ